MCAAGRTAAAASSHPVQCSCSEAELERLSLQDSRVPLVDGFQCAKLDCCLLSTYASVVFIDCFVEEKLPISGAANSPIVLLYQINIWI